jgi:hypothetical protein
VKHESRAIWVLLSHRYKLRLKAFWLLQPGALCEAELVRFCIILN